MQWLKNRLCVKDRCPPTTDGRWVVGATYVPGLCLERTRTALCGMNVNCMIRAASQMHEGIARFIYSGCYGGEEMMKELHLRHAIATGWRVPENKIWEIHGITDTRDELMKLLAVLKGAGVTSVLLVSDEYHMPRLVRWAKILLPGIEVYHISVHTERYRRTWESTGLMGWVKSVRAGFRPLWIGWNLTMNLATPILLRKELRARRVDQRAAEREAKQRAKTA